jgi:DNA segregation ATPase FtsK/SpoIIIE, S-DNA-T family
MGNSLQSMLPTLDFDNFTLPALISFRGGKSVLFEARGEAKERAIEAVQSMMLRLLATIPPGKLKFLFIDPVGLGQNMARFMPLSDYEESLISSRCWSEPQHIEQRLADITVHMETVIQKYLRSEFSNIEDYNAQAGETAEPYIAVVVMDFPVNFSGTAARRLHSIAENGPRCGVYTFVVDDTQKEPPHGFNTDDLQQVCEVISWNEDRFVWQDPVYRSCHLELDRLPSDEFVAHIVNSVGEKARDDMKIEVPFSRILKQAGLDGDSLWSRTSENKVEIPLGPAGARKIQSLELGVGMGHHAVIVGRPGSGKSNLMHIIITAGSLLYSPEELQFYLIDFKKGVEFKPYTDPPLPHARVVAVESEREFGFSVLQGLDNELQERGELFRKKGVNNITEYRKSHKKKVLPRIILIVDEFQEFFVQEDQVSREAGLILDRLVRQGRAFGIQVLLGSQTLAGSYSLPRSTLDQMGVRIALQCSDADSRLILADDNPAARLLSRPGEAIYNKASGLVEGNNLFQVALFNEEDRLHYLGEVSRKAQNTKQKYFGPIVFEGHEPAILENCGPLKDLFSMDNWPKDLKAADAFLGEPIAIRPPTKARFRRQSGSHLLAITREERGGVGFFVSTILSLAAQHSPEEASFYVVNFISADTEWAGLPGEIGRILPHRMQIAARRELPDLLSEMVDLSRQRLDNDSASEQRIYLFFLGLHRARDLRLDNYGFGMGGFENDKPQPPPEQFAYLLREGPETGIHIISWCDTYGNLMRVLERRTLSEFSMRVTGVMSTDDSMHLLDDPAASKLDKPHRMIFFDEDRPGFLEKFRPYALPEKRRLHHLLVGLNERMS